jgi:ubiquinone/menaquinone biosynthesis C-methylase UbiE
VASPVEYFETEIKKLVSHIPPGECPGVDDYINSSGVINRQIRAFLLYRTYAETGSRFLDWGCGHAWDSCLIRMVSSKASIHGCDIVERVVETTREFAGMRYTQLQHPWKLPYADRSFDRVIGSGVLEHVPVPSASLVELNRVMELGGYLVITFCPNKFSCTEFVSRKCYAEHGSWHRRRYTRSQLKRALLEHGFEPIELGYHQLLPSLASGREYLRSAWMRDVFKTIFKLDPLAERIWPLKLFSANLYAIACKRDYM